MKRMAQRLGPDPTDHEVDLFSPADVLRDVGQPEPERPSCPSL